MGETCHVQASVAFVRSSSTIRTSWPATARSILGSTRMSSSVQMPVGVGSGVLLGVGDFVALLFFLPPDFVVGSTLGVASGVPAACSAFGSASDEPSLPPPSTPAITTTSAAASPSAKSLRRQYTPGGSGPRVIDVMVATLRSARP